MSQPDDGTACEICGDRIVDNGPGISWIIHPWTCGRCGKRVCFGCGGYSAGLGYGNEDSEKYGDICTECSYELRESYAGKWESEFGGEASFDNPYELSQDERELRERIRSGAWRTSSDG
jgi:hypothetical protein